MLMLYRSFSDSDFSDNSDSEDNNSTPAGPSGETLQSNINKFLDAAIYFYLNLF